jgi:hypothetical protein
MRMLLPCCLSSATIPVTCNLVIRVPALTHLPHVTLLRDNRLAIKLKATAERRDIDPRFVCKSII